MATSPLSYDWIREIQPELKALDDIPLTGAAPSFPWEDLSARIERAFERSGFLIQPKELLWRSKEELYEGLGDSPFPLTFAIPTLNGSICWVMPEQEMTILETWLLTKESHPLSFQDRSLSESFYRFFALEILYHMSQVSFDKTIAPVLMNQSSLPTENSLCLDISLSLQEQIIWGRLIISSDLRRSWVEHYAHNETSLLTQQMAQSVEVIVHLEAGKTHLSLKDWSSVALGDFILLDNCSLTSENFTGRVLLTVNDRQAFRAKLKDGNIKILELPLYHEVNTPMAKQAEDEDEDDLSDLDLTEDEDQDDLDLEEEESDDLDLEGESLADDNEGLFDEDDVSPTNSNPIASKEPLKTNSEKPTEVATNKFFTPDQIPVALTVEVGRIQMTMEKLLKLEPGNLLELNIHPENGVDLTINGKVVGKGELLRIGESLGVRVLELGH